MKSLPVAIGIVALLASAAGAAETPLVDQVNPFLGTAPLTNVRDIGFVPRRRVWAGLTFPGASLPNAMVQLSPVTKFGSGAGYEYEDTRILAFTHTNKGHWNLCYVPMLPVQGETDPRDFSSPFSHARESAHPGYYQVFLERHGINAELTVTPRCGYHRYSYGDGRDKRLVLDLGTSNERVTEWGVEPDGGFAFRGFQKAREKVYFYARSSRPIRRLSQPGDGKPGLTVLEWEGDDRTVEVRIGLSFVSTENARLNLETELAGKDFDAVRADASRNWEALLGNIRVTGGTARQRGLFYSSLYRSFLWPALRSDVNGDFTDEGGHVVRKGFSYYTTPSLWDDYRNKLVLLTLLSPKVAEDVIQSMIDRGGVTGFMPTFFHGDHAAAFVAGTYLRGVRGFDVKRAYALLRQNAMVENARARPHLAGYLASGYVATEPVPGANVETKSTAGVTKTLEYAYDDYAVALLAHELGDVAAEREFWRRAGNYANVFDASTGLMRGRDREGRWVEPFDPQYPYYEYMYREANAWQSSFFAPHDTEGLIRLFPSREAFERQLDRLFTLPWNPDHIAMNVNSFIGQYCHGNQPDHGFPYLYYWVGRPEKSQAIIDEILERFYGMDSGITLCGMDDAGEMSAWYVFNAIGLYTYSPADPEYIVTVPLFDEVRARVNGHPLTIVKAGASRRFIGADIDGRKLPAFSVTHADLMRASRLTIRTAAVEESPKVQTSK